MKLKELFAALFMLLFPIDILAQTSFTISDGAIENEALKTKIERNMTYLLATFRLTAESGKKTISLSRDYMTKDAIDDVEEMWKSSSMSCPPMDLKSRCLHTTTGYQVRGIPVDIHEAVEAEARQELTVNFNKEGLIDGVSIAIEMNRYEQLMAQQSSDLDYTRRQIIIDFVENFRTAYNRKDIKLLNSMYSDKALIITGKVVMEKPNSDVNKMTLLNNKVVYLSQTKQQYLQRLSNVFNKTRYINVSFSDIDVVQHPKYDDIYGVTLRQVWHTDNYRDEGYLFLMIDFHDEYRPLVQVRTWQPYKDDAGNVVTTDDEIFHLGSFKILR
ncbi:MAG: hypothetical protein IIT55_10135 [Bacteroidaceae bacterium]|jgi:hypothetical protein|nr:hypothetical protein [Bacteroidaceae bacterium]MBQ5462180.1 hypothetical protein [Bacteroidaceae bacterium]